MRIEIKNSTSHPDAPIAEMFNAVGVQLFHFGWRWPGASHVVGDLNRQGFYIELVDKIPEAPGALGYHDIDSDGRPYSRVGADLSLDNGSDWLTGPISVVSVVGHEVLETVANPICNIWRDIQPGVETAQEVCDAVEQLGYEHNGCDLTNFLLPAWFNPFGKPPFDYLGAVQAPFTMGDGGYMIIRRGGVESQETQGGKTAAMLLAPDYPLWRLAYHHRAIEMGVTA